MSNEKQGKMPEWKERFLQWEQSGGTVASEEDVLWDKLQERLQPRRKKRGFYFFRAAALIVVVAGLFLLLRKKDNTATPDGPMTQPDVVTIPTMLPGQTPGPIMKESAANPAMPSEPVISIRSGEGAVREKQTNRKNIGSTTIKEVAAKELPEIISPEDEAVANTIEKQESVVVPIVTTVVPKRKLKVVHVNDLNAPPPPTYAKVREDWKPFAQPEPEENNVVAPSIWPGKNKYKPAVSLVGN